MQSKAANLAQLLLALVAALYVQPTTAWTKAQATWYDGIMAGYCGYFDNIPSNQFVAAWPMIETGPPGTGQEYWQPGISGNACGQCVEVRCIPGFVENSLGSIYIDRTGDCRDEGMGIVVKVIDECRCSGADLALSDRGNFNWCCNQPTPRLGIDRHIDLSRAAFTQLIRGGDFGLGIMQIAFRPASCDYIGLTRIQSDGSSTPLSGGSPISTPAPSSIQGGSSNPPPSSSSDNAAPVYTPAPANPPPPPPSNPPSPASNPSPPSNPASPATDSTSGSDSKQDSNTDSSNNAANNGNTADSSAKSDSSSTTSQETTSDSPAPDSITSTGQADSTTDKSDKSSTSSSSSPVVQEAGIFETPTVAAAAPGDVGQTETVTAGELAVTLSHYSQCGGSGGNCRSAGGERSCGDLPFAGYTCEGGLMCVRKNRWYWQCLSQDEVDRIKKERNPNWQTESPTKPEGCNKLLYIGEQCGGIGGNCQDAGCVDQQVPKTCCESGSYCKRFDAWYRECRPDGSK